jgi:hypothetical protein
MAYSITDEVETLCQLIAHSETRLEGYTTEEQQLKSKRQREEITLSNLKAARQAMEGGTLDEMPINPESINENGEQHFSSTASRMSQPIPHRKLEYLDGTILMAIERVLERLKGEHEFVHVDDLVKEIYVPISDNDQFYRVKRTLVSEIIRGMKKNLFTRGPKPNSFGLPRGGEEVAA